MKNELKGRLGKLFRKAVLRGYSFPVLVSLLLHASLLLVLSTNWSVERKLNIAPPRTIKASLVEVVQPAPQPQSRPQVDDSARREREAAERRRQAEEQRQREVALRKEQEAKEQARKEEEARKERERQRKLEEERKRQQEQERQRRQREETLRRLEQERLQREHQEAAAQQAAKQAERQAEKDAAEVAYYSELLNNLIGNNWNRPPSARNNMTVLLQVTLSPFGDLLEVKLLEGSGSDSFDRSAVQAVQRAAPFPELRKLDRRIFDANFRRFNFRFRPEDLVR